MPRAIITSVGVGGSNRKADVIVVQELLNAVPAIQGGPVTPLKVDGYIGPLTNSAIRTFQEKQFGKPKADGRVDPGQRTIGRLNELVDAAAAPPPPPPLETPFDVHIRSVKPVTTNKNSALNLVDPRDWFFQVSCGLGKPPAVFHLSVERGEYLRFAVPRVFLGPRTLLAPAYYNVHNYEELDGRGAMYSSDLGFIPRPPHTDYSTGQCRSTLKLGGFASQAVRHGPIIEATLPHHIAGAGYGNSYYAQGDTGVSPNYQFPREFYFTPFSTAREGVWTRVDPRDIR